MYHQQQKGTTVRKITFRVSDDLRAEFRAACRRRCPTQDEAGRQALENWVNPPLPKVLIEECPARGMVVVVAAISAIVGFVVGWLCL